MLGNRDWIRLEHEAFPQYHDALASLCAEGIALADMTGVFSSRKFLLTSLLPK